MSLVSLKLSDSFMKSYYESGMFKEDYEDESPSKHYPQKLTTQRQKSFESHLSSTLMRVKLVLLKKTTIGLHFSI